MTIRIPPEIETRLKAEAARRGMDADDYAREIIVRNLPPAPDAQSLSELFAEWEAEDHTEDAAELAQRGKDEEQFMRNLARNRIEMEGPNARKLWP